MDTIIITANRTGDSEEYDLAVRTDIPISQLSEFIAQGLKWNVDTNGQAVIYKVEIVPPGRKLRPDVTLADAQARNGARLIFHKVLHLEADQTNASTEDSKVILQVSTDNPVIGHRGLKTSTLSESLANEQQGETRGYTFKQIDEE
jgi:hypothetical protein